MMKKFSRWLPALVMMSLCASVLPSAAQRAIPQNWSCGTFTREGRLDAEDYRRPTKRLQVVEAYHYGPTVEALIRPMQRGMTIGSDLDYTLWGYPNHHRALITLVRLAAREKTDKPAGSEFTVDCYFARAFLIAPDDVVARMIYAKYLGETKRLDQAMSNMKLVVEQGGDNPLTHLNAGLVYLELGAVEEAKAQAVRVSELGFPNDRLVEAINNNSRPQATPASTPKSAVTQAPSPPNPPQAVQEPAKKR